MWPQGTQAIRSKKMINKRRQASSVAAILLGQATNFKFDKAIFEKGQELGKCHSPYLAAYAKVIDTPVDENNPVTQCGRWPGIIQKRWYRDAPWLSIFSFST